MKKVAFAAVAAIAAFAVTLGFAPSAQGYPDVRIDLTVDHSVIYGGESFKATATSNVQCAWTLEWNGVVRQSTGTRYVTSYAAPQVTTITKIPLNGVCSYTAPAAAGGSRIAAGLTTWHRTIVITVLPRASAVSPPPDNSADLPGTGGPNKIFLLSGLVLLLAGATAVTVARRRAEEHELPMQTA